MNEIYIAICGTHDGNIFVGVARTFEGAASIEDANEVARVVLTERDTYPVDDIETYDTQPLTEADIDKLARLLGEDHQRIQCLRAARVQRLEEEAAARERDRRRCPVLQMGT